MTELAIIHVPPANIHPNPWNPNRMNAFMYAKAIESIQRYGMIDPLLVRDVGPQDYQIIDGEHRYNACVDEGYPLIPCISLGEMSDVDAKKLTITMNELRGQAAPKEMGDLLKDLLKDSSVEALLEELPYTEDMLRGLTELPALAELPDLPKGEKEPAWVEKLYRMPPAAAKILDDAIYRAKGGDEIDDWQALERLAADYLAG